MKQPLEVYKKSLIWLYAVDLATALPCQVWLKGKHMTVMVMTEEKIVYNFIEVSPGHYDSVEQGCTPEEVRLHRFQGGNYLEGSTKYGETFRTLMWRIRLDEFLKGPDVVDTILLKDGRKWVKQKITAFKDSSISTTDFKDVMLEEIGDTWKLLEAK